MQFCPLHGLAVEVHIYLLFPQFVMQVNNAGITIDKPTLEYTAEEYSITMATNLESAFHLCQLSHPLLKASGSGSIVFISSVCGVIAEASSSIYSLTKGKPCS
jgi:Tropinone reductase 1